jgi:dipeptide/tripeptide permease
MTGILFMAGALARTIGPIVVSFLFDNYGPEATWGMEMAVLGVTIGIWVVFYRKIEPYEADHIHPESLDRKDSIISTKTESLSIERL